MRSKKRKNQKKWYQAYIAWAKTHKSLLTAVTVVLVAGAGAIGYILMNQPDLPSNKTAAASISSAKLVVQSDPVGISISGKPDCDSSALKQVTPFICQVSKSIDTVITAPDTVTIEGKTYTFKTWDGCSESNDVKTICKAKAWKGSTHTIKATYDTAAAAKRNTVASQPVNKTNDQACTVTIDVGRARGLGPGRAMGSSSGKDSVCTVFMRNPPAAGYKLKYSTVYDKITRVSCGDNCGHYDQFAVMSYYNWYRLVNLAECQYEGTDDNHGCANYATYPEPDTLRKPARLQFRAMEVFDEYYGPKGDGCKYYYCATKSTFLGWQMSVENGNASTPTTIHIVGNYSMDIAYDPTYISSPETDKRRDELAEIFQRIEDL